MTKSKILLATIALATGMWQLMRSHTLYEEGTSLFTSGMHASSPAEFADHYPRIAHVLEDAGLSPYEASFSPADAEHHIGEIGYTLRVAYNRGTRLGWLLIASALVLVIHNYIRTMKTRVRTTASSVRDSRGAPREPVR